MARRKIQLTTVVAPKGQRVHAVSLSRPMVTACGRKFSGWPVAIRHLDCRQCKLAMFYDCRKKPARRRGRARRRSGVA